jgi:hypothetical protein
LSAETCAVIWPPAWRRARDDAAAAALGDLEAGGVAGGAAQHALIAVGARPSHTPTSANTWPSTVSRLLHSQPSATVRVGSIDPRSVRSADSLPPALPAMTGKRPMSTSVARMRRRSSVVTVSPKRITPSPRIARPSLGRRTSSTVRSGARYAKRGIVTVPTTGTSSMTTSSPRMASPSE